MNYHFVEVAAQERSVDRIVLGRGRIWAGAENGDRGYKLVIAIT